MLVRKAVVTAAAPDQNTLPLQRLVDRDGVEKTALQLIAQEILSAGIEEIAVIVRPGDEASYEEAAGHHRGAIRFLTQDRPLGYADAIHRAADFTAGEPFLHLVGDHLYLSATERPCAGQLIEIAKDVDCCVSAVQSTRENRLPYFGIVAGTRVPQHERLFEITQVAEKPTPTLAEQELITPGLRSGHYLGFFGMHVLTPAVTEVISELLAEPEKGTGGAKPTLADALAILARRGRYLAYRIEGTRYNIGVQYGLLIAQLAIGLAGRDRELILTEMVESLAGQLGGSNGQTEVRGSSARHAWGADS